MLSSTTYLPSRAPTRPSADVVPDGPEDTLRSGVMLPLAKVRAKATSIWVSPRAARPCHVSERNRLLRLGLYLELQNREAVLLALNYLNAAVFKKSAFRSLEVPVCELVSYHTHCELTFGL